MQKMLQMIMTNPEMMKSLPGKMQTLEKTTSFGESPNGFVKVAINGIGRITQLKLDPRIKEEPSMEAIENMISKTINDTRDKNIKEVADAMKN